MVQKLRLLVFMYNTRRYGESLGGAERRILQFSKFAHIVETHFLEREPTITKFYSKQPSHVAWMINPKLNFPNQFRAMIWALTAFLLAIKLNNKFCFNVLVSHDPEFWNILPLLLTSKVTGRPSVAYLHHTERTANNIPSRNFTDFYFYFKNLGYKTVSSILSAIEKILSIALLNKFDLLLSVSKTTKKDFVDRGVLDSKIFGWVTEGNSSMSVGGFLPRLITDT